MAIYGTGILALCLLGGLVLGRILGWLVGLEANLGGVGIAMLLLMACCERMRVKGRLPVPTENGILFWSSIYIPIVVAMAASQNVLAALQGGLMAIVAGTISVVVCFSLVPLLSRIGGDDEVETS